MSLGKIARNKTGDDVYKLFGGFAHRVTSKDWQVFALQDQFENLINGSKDRSKLITYSILKPSIFDGFASTTIAGACFEDTMLHRVWTAQGIDLEPVHDQLRCELRYDRHPNGHLVTIFYATEEEWSKTFRDKNVGEQKVIDQIVKAVGDAMGKKPFIWMGNNDLKGSKDPFAHMANAERLPNSPHGLNQFQHFHNVVVLSALNPPPAHFHFMETHGISGDEIKTAHYRSAVYQAVMRCSARKPDDENPKQFVVMDRTTAEWLADLFPGAQVEPLDGMGVQPRKGKPGRNRKHASNAARNRAYNERKKQGLMTQLDLINGTSLVAGRYPVFAQEVRSGMKEFAGTCDENTVYRGEIVTPPLTSGTAFSSVYETIPLDHVDYSDDQSFITGLRDLHGRVVAAKEESGVFSPAHFEADKAEETGRGLDNITHLRGIWLDNDGGDLTYKEFASFFPYLRIVVWNTYSSTPEKPRWRAFVPTSDAMSIDVHQIILAQIEKVLNKQGYWGKRQLEKKTGIKTRRCHGFDESKFNAASLFYLPCQAKDPQHSFFHDFNDPKRGPLDLHQWIENCILDLRPDPEPEPRISTETVDAPVISSAKVSSSLQAVREKLLAEKAQSHAGRQQAAIDKATDEWRSAPPGDGHNAFFRLGAALQRAGLDESEIREKLREEVGHAHSKSERRKEIPGILKSLRRRGTFGRAA
ncbi:hypothetical protein ILT44_29925 [Microvirga sp. BT689]|uniref:hypothetical protein n=1 Tax=Microvirga arvi TaxID=2778731 RepID=UPI00194E5819|nr:hypothetical protein [Microvirga arvi]MBM6584416.1 hypothetical protein [Microvirga arvi]